MRILDQVVCSYFVDNVTQALLKRVLPEETLNHLLKVEVLDELRPHVNLLFKEELINLSASDGPSISEKRLALCLLREPLKEDRKNIERLYGLFFDKGLPIQVKSTLLYTVLQYKILNEKEMMEILTEFERDKKTYLNQVIAYSGGDYDKTMQSLSGRLNSEEHKDKRFLYFHSLGLFQEKREEAVNLLNAHKASASDFEKKIIEKAIINLKGNLNI